MQPKNDIQTLIKMLRANGSPPKDLEDVKKAYAFAAVAFGEQKRASGKLQIEHALNVARLLAEWRLTPDIVAAGLLHDITENCPINEEKIREEFGYRIARMITGETRLDTLKYWGKERYAENLRRMFLAMAEDVQIVFIKFADRIDNLKTLEYLPEEKRKRLASESIEIYAAIAGRLGMESVRQELEDFAFKHLHPKEYQWVDGIADNYLKDNEKLIETIKNEVAVDAKKLKIKIIDIGGRAKSIYSLYHKLLAHERNIKKVYDILAVRIVVEDVASCYALLGVIHHRWKPLPRRIKDYIAQSKPNGYRSLHTNVFAEGKVIEFQIRTQEMQEEAEFGIAAHWLYKEKLINIKNNIKKHTAWLKELSTIQKELKEKAGLSQALQSVKIDLFQNRIFVFTPSGDVIELPEDATPIDLAYAVHANLGDYCSGALVNGIPAKLDTKLRSNDVVEIKKGDKPCANKHWLKIATTRRAKKLIKEALKKY